MESTHAADIARPRASSANAALPSYPTYLNGMVAGLAYRLETYAMPLRDGVFPGLCMERQFIKRLCVEGVELIELQRANGSRQVIAATAIERVCPLGRANLEPDTLRQAPLPAITGREIVSLLVPVSTLTF